MLTIEYLVSRTGPERRLSSAALEELTLVLRICEQTVWQRTVEVVGPRPGYATMRVLVEYIITWTFVKLCVTITAQVVPARVGLVSEHTVWLRTLSRSAVSVGTSLGIGVEYLIDCTFLYLTHVLLAQKESPLVVTIGKHAVGLWALTRLRLRPIQTSLVPDIKHQVVSAITKMCDTIDAMIEPVVTLWMSEYAVWLGTLEGRVNLLDTFPVERLKYLIYRTFAQMRNILPTIVELRLVGRVREHAFRFWT